MSPIRARVLAAGACLRQGEAELPHRIHGASVTNTYDRRGRLVQVGTSGSVMQNTYNDADELLG